MKEYKDERLEELAFNINPMAGDEHTMGFVDGFRAAERELKSYLLHNVSQRTYSADTIEKLESEWRKIMNNGWDVKKPIDVRWNWIKFDYEFYFVAKYVG